MQHRVPRGGRRSASESHPDLQDSDDEAAQASMPTQRASARRKATVDFSKLETTSLLKYCKYFKLADGNTKDELILAVGRHFAAQVVEDEDDTLLQFALSVRRQSGVGAYGGAIAKKQRTAYKPTRGYR